MSKRIEALRKKLGVKSKAASAEATCAGGCGHERARLNPYSPGYHWIEEYNRWYPRNSVPEKVANVGKHTHDLGTAHSLPRNQGGETAVYFVMPCGDLWAQDVDEIVDVSMDDVAEEMMLDAIDEDNYDWLYAGSKDGIEIEIAEKHGKFFWRAHTGDGETIFTRNKGYNSHEKAYEVAENWIRID